MTTRLDSERLLLRPLSRGDQELYCLLYTDPAVMARIARPQTLGEATRGFQASLRMQADPSNRRCVWAMCLKPSALALGLIGIDRDDEGGAEVGVVLPVAQQGRGYATEAIGALAAHAFGALGLLRLHTRHAPAHGQAAGLMRALGFERVHADDSEHGWRWQLTPDLQAQRQRRPDPLP